MLGWVRHSVSEIGLWVIKVKSLSSKLARLQGQWDHVVHSPEGCRDVPYFSSLIVSSEAVCPFLLE